jgi:hypothetical protein
MTAPARASIALQSVETELSNGSAEFVSNEGRSSAATSALANGQNTLRASADAHGFVLVAIPRVAFPVATEAPPTAF